MNVSKQIAGILKKKEGSPHMGKLLKSLSLWFNKGDIPFAKAVGKSQKWFYDSVKLERIPLKHIIGICRAMNIPIEYFEGKFELPNNIASTNINGEYSEKSIFLEEENRQLRRELNDLQRKLIELHEKYNKALEDKNSFV